MKPTAELDAIIQPAADALGLEYVGCEFQQHVLRVYIDKVGGVNLDDCERASRQISALLDVADPIPRRYQLEVSSPGIERPLFHEAHYQRFIGRKVKIRLKAPIGDRRHYAGVITAVENGEVIVNVEGQHIRLVIAAIDKANLV